MGAKAAAPEYGTVGEDQSGGTTSFTSTTRPLGAYVAITSTSEAGAGASSETGMDDDAMQKLDELGKRQEALARQQQNSRQQTMEQRYEQERLKRAAEELKKQLEQMQQQQQSGGQQSQGQQRTRA